MASLLQDKDKIFNFVLMKKILYILPLLLLLSVYAKGQDTLRVQPPFMDTMDSTLINTSVFSLLSSTEGGDITVNQTAEVKGAFERYLAQQSAKKRNGYKVLVYSSNAQSARRVSAGIESSLRGAYPNLKVYRDYKAPYFMVHVGDFRNKSDAMKICYELSSEYKQAKVVKSVIGWYAF